MPERSAKEIFGEASERPREERAAFLDEACRGRPELRREVEALLAAWDHAGGFLAAPTAQASPEDGGERPGTRIGPYKLLQKIGEGGMGAVYMAEQEEPVRRRVALKIIKLGMDTRQVIARFEAERQALAMMDHPNIAKVLDAGATESGRPYFVMELVKGVALHEYCDANNLPTRERLELFIAVCNAVQHAHQKGIIHRDLKPSNVLVTLHDGKPVPKVIDFGIAKATSARLTEKTLFTEFRSFIGTPEYMSPEQAAISGLDVDTRSDIYALGVLLYELLTGTTPFDAVTLRRAAFDELRRIIREEEPPKPSTRISTLGDARAAVARRRDTDPAALSRALRGDLDWIVMRALEKDRTRRYETASALAEDVRRHLASRPVLATPPSVGYLVRKFVARNRAAVVFVGLLLLLLLCAVVGTSWGFLVARRQEAVAVQAHERALVAQQEAEQQAQAARAAREDEELQRLAAEAARAEALRLKQLAESEADNARAVTDFLVDTLALADPGVALSPEVTMRAVLDRAAQQVGPRFEAQPEAEARLRATIGKAYYSLGEIAFAEPHLRRAVELWDRSEDVDRWELYEALWPLTSVVFVKGSPEITSLGQRVMLLSWQLIGQDHLELAEALARMVGGNMGGDVAQGRAGYDEALRIAARELADGDRLWQLVADNLFASGYAPWYYRGDPVSAIYLRKALDIYRRALPELHPQTALTMEVLVEVLNAIGEFMAAESLVRESLEMRRRLLPTDDESISASQALLGECLAGQGRFEEAETLLLESCAAYPEAPGTLSALVRLYEAWSRPERAQTFRDELAASFVRGGYVPTIAVARPAFGPEHQALLADLERVQGFGSRVQAGDDRAALEVELQGVLDRLLPARRELLPDDHPLAALIARELLSWVGQWTIDEGSDLRGRVLDEVRAILEHRADELPGEYGWSLYGLARSEQAHGRRAQAEILFREALELLRRGHGERSSLVAEAMMELGKNLRDQGRNDEAEPLLCAAYPILSEQIGELNRDTFRCAQLIEGFYRGWGRPEGARPFVARQIEALRRLSVRPTMQRQHLRDYATFLLTCTPEDLRDPATAVIFAERANELSEENPADVELLTQARYAAGDVAGAMDLLRDTLERMAPDNAARARLEERLAQYEAAR